MKPVYKIFFFISILLTIVAIAVTIVVWNKTGGSFLNIDFRGGSMLEVVFQDKVPAVSEIQNALNDIPGIANASIAPTGENGIIIRSKKINEATHEAVIAALQKNYETATEQRFSDIGPTVGKELKAKSIQAIIILLVVVVAYISIVFRKMKRVLSPWAMGIAAVLALVHDVIVPVGVFSLLGYFVGVEISAVFVAAALTILGYSVSDTVVVFDRIRENVIRQGGKEPFGEIVHKSIMQTLTRSINTSATTLLSLLAIFFFGGDTIKYFALALIIGIASGTYSSVFIASPIIVWWHTRWYRKA